MDWVPLRNYGVVTSVPAGTTATVSLWDVPDQEVQFEGVMEDENRDVFVHRIVGTWHVDQGGDAGANQPCHVWRIMPLQSILELGTLEVPWTTWNMFRDPGPTNLRFWDERVWSALVSFDQGDGHHPIHHPYLMNVDIKPKQAFGIRRNLWPAWVVENNADTDTLRVSHRWRALVS